MKERGSREKRQYTREGAKQNVKCKCTYLKLGDSDGLSVGEMLGLNEGESDGDSGAMPPIKLKKAIRESVTISVAISLLVTTTA